MTDISSSRVHWSSRMMFVLAACGSAIGLGNIWKFPYITGLNGGGAFVLIYLVCIAAVGVPILMAELYIGQTAQRNTVASFEAVHRKRTPWRIAGWMGLLSAFLILSFYSVVGGWVLDFAWKSAAGHFSNQTEAGIKEYLGNLFANPGHQIVCHAVFMTITVGVVAAGIKSGLERCNKILMPIFFGLLLLLLVRAFFLEGFGQAIDFLFSFDASKLTGAGILEAVGHSFFTLSLGMGAMITYGSYLSEKEDLFKTAITVAFLDTAIALLAGVVIFSVVFSFGLEPGAGPTLIFSTLPYLFSQIPGGYVISIMFFLLVGFAALTSAVSLLEVVVAYGDESHRLPRKWTTVGVGSIMFVLGCFCALSLSPSGSETWSLFGKSLFDLFDKLTSSFALPVGGMAISLFYGWILGPRAVAATLEKSRLGHGAALGLLWSARVVAPVAVAAVLANALKNW